MLELLGISTEVQNKTSVKFCIKDIADDNIAAYISVFLHDCKTDACNCKDTSIEFTISMSSFECVSDDAIEYANEHLDNDENYDNDAELVFDLNKFIEATQILNLPELTTSMLVKLPPKLLVYNYVVDYVDERKYTNHVHDNLTYNETIGDYEMTYASNYNANDCLSVVKHEYSWILEDKEFNEEKVNTLNKSLKISLVQMIQDVEKVYNKLYGILIEYENPNGLLK